MHRRNMYTYPCILLKFFFLYSSLFNAGLLMLIFYIKAAYCRPYHWVKIAASALARLSGEYLNHCHLPTLALAKCALQDVFLFVQHLQKAKNKPVKKRRFCALLCIFLTSLLLHLIGEALRQKRGALWVLYSGTHVLCTARNYSVITAQTTTWMPSSLITILSAWQVDWWCYAICLSAEHDAMDLIPITASIPSA